MKEREDMNRRNFLKGTGAAATAGVASIAGCSTDKNPADADSEWVETQSSGIPGLEFKSHTGKSDYPGQYGGGPQNKASVDSDESPIDIESVTSVEEDVQIDRLPVVGPDGNVAATGEGNVILAGNGDSEVLDADGIVSTPLIHEGKLYYGDQLSDNIMDVESGEIKESIESDNRVFRTVSNDGRFFRDEGGGLEQFDPDNLDTVNEIDIVSNPRPYGFIPREDDFIAVFEQGVGKWDYEGDRLASRENKSYNTSISGTDDVVVAIRDGDDILEILDADDMAEEASLENSVFTQFEAPCAVSGDSFYNVNREGVAFGTSYDDENEELGLDWQAELDGDGLNTVVWGDILAVGTSEQVVGLDTESGEEVWSTDDANGFVSMPHDDRLYVGGTKDPNIDYDDELYRLGLTLGTRAGEKRPEMNLESMGDLPDEMVVGEEEPWLLYVENSGEGDFDGMFSVTFGTEVGDEYHEDLPYSLDSKSNEYLALIYNPVPEEEDFNLEWIDSIDQVDRTQVDKSMRGQHPIKFPEGEDETTATVELGIPVSKVQDYRKV